MGEIGPHIGVIVEHTSHTVLRQAPEDPAEAQLMQDRLLMWGVDPGIRRFSALVPSQGMPDGTYEATVEPWWGIGPSRLVQRDSGTVTVMRHRSPVFAAQSSLVLPYAELHVEGAATDISEEQLLKRIVGPLVQAVAALEGRTRGLELAALPADDETVQVTRYNDQRIAGERIGMSALNGADPRTHKLGGPPGTLVIAEGKASVVDSHPGAEKLAAYHLGRVHQALAELVFEPAEQRAASQ